MKIIRGVFASLLYTTNLVIMALVIILGSIFVVLTPSHKGRHFISKQLQKISVLWGDINAQIMRLSHPQWDIQGTEQLNPKKSYLLMSNHLSGLDILVLCSIFNHKTPPFKFFMKKQLVWSLPLAGLACWALGFPLMGRHSKSEIKKNPKLKYKDSLSAKKACDKIREFPSTMINFVEGTRFTPTKHQRQRSPYKNLLKPRAGGLAMVVNELEHELQGILHVTLVYSGAPMTLWKFITGWRATISVHYQVLPITKELVGDYYNDREYRRNFQLWLNKLWQAKDKEIQQIKSEYHEGSS